VITSDPQPFREALDAHDVRSILPTTGRSQDLQRLDSAIKRRAIWSATVALVQPLELIRDGTSAILAGQADQATVRLAIKQVWKSLGIHGDPTSSALQDVTSTERINLQIETNVAVMRGAGWREQGMQPDVLDEFPAQEFYDTRSGGEHRRTDWKDRWIAAGGKFPDGRMVALKTDKVWENLGSPELFADGLGNPWPPFAFNSAWRVRDIGRDEAEALGLIGANEELLPQPLDLAADLAAAPELRQDWLRTAIEESGVGSFRDGVLEFAGGGS